MTMRDILREKGSEIMTVDLDTGVPEVARVMMERNIGALLVEDDGKLCGIVTERDVVKTLSRDKDCANVRIKDVMTSNLIVSKPGDDLDYVMAVMIQNNIRHLPVVEETGLVGMLSMRDVVRVLVKNLKAENQYLRDFIGGSFEV